MIETEEVTGTSTQYRPLATLENLFRYLSSPERQRPSPPPRLWSRLVLKSTRVHL